jgi:hypothetical protein
MNPWLGHSGLYSLGSGKHIWFGVFRPSLSVVLLKQLRIYIFERLATARGGGYLFNII